MRHVILPVALIALAFGAQPATAEVVADSSPYYMPFPIVFIHGLASDSTTWNTTIDDQFKVYLIQSPNAQGILTPSYGLDDQDPFTNDALQPPGEREPFFSRANYGDINDPDRDHGSFQNLSDKEETDMLAAASEAIRIVAGEFDPTVTAGDFTGFVQLRGTIDAALALQAQSVPKLLTAGPCAVVVSLSGTRYNIEVDGRKHFFDAAAIAEDESRDAALSHAGYKVIRLRATDLLADGNRLIEMLSRLA